MEDVELDYGAITIDNSTLKGEGYKFYEGLLKQMVQFSKSPVKVVQADIVHNEAKKHISNEIKNAKSSVNQALRSALKHLRISKESMDAASGLLTVEVEDNDLADDRLKEYYKWIGAEVLNSNAYVDFERLMSMYFETKAPFEGGKNKKNEFPDAIALISLEAWAEENDTNIIAVSGDKGWKAFSENSDRINVIDNLAAAFEVFQPHTQVTNIIAHIREDALLEDENRILQEIEKAITNSLDWANVEIEASSAFYYEEDEVYVTYLEHALAVDDSGLVEVKVVRIEEEAVVLKVRADVQCEVSATFGFSVRDSIDRDYVGMGSSTCTTEELYTTDILICLTGDFAKGIESLDVDEIEVLETIKYAEFGEIEPDWGHYDEE